MQASFCWKTSWKNLGSASIKTRAKSQRRFRPRWFHGKFSCLSLGEIVVNFGVKDTYVCRRLFPFNSQEKEQRNDRSEIGRAQLFYIISMFLSILFFLCTARPALLPVVAVLLSGIKMFCTGAITLIDDVRKKKMKIIQTSFQLSKKFFHRNDV